MSTKDTSFSTFSSRFDHVIVQTSGKDKRNQADFAALIGMPTSTLNGYLKSGKIPNPEYLIRISEESGFHITWLLTGKGPARIAEHIKEEKVHSDCFQEVAELQEWLAEISEEDPGRRVWFKMELKDHFPLFKEWLKKRHQANSEVGKQQAA